MFQKFILLPSFFPGGGTHALYGRRDVRRYNAIAAFSRVSANRANVNGNCHGGLLNRYNSTARRRRLKAKAVAGGIRKRAKEKSGAGWESGLWSKTYTACFSGAL
jgi:hypothetical protein